MDCLLSRITHLSRERKVEFQRFHSVRIMQQHRQHTRWKPPDQGSFEVNYDGAILVAQGRASLGVVIRNSNGAVMASLTQQIPNPTTMAQVEALAARRAVEFALEIGITSTIFEGDSDIIIKDLNGLEPPLALNRHLIQDVKLLESFFNCISFVHVRHQRNNVAHALARRALNSPSLMVWMEDVPLDIFYFVQADFASFAK